MTTKVCNECKQTKPLDRFAKNRTKPDGLHTSCKDCKNKYNSTYYKGNTSYFRSKTKDTRVRLAKWIHEYKLTQKCKCGESHPACLQFHHTDKSKKDFEIAVAARMGYSIERIIQEIKKCEVICANCHFKFHYDEKYGPLGERLKPLDS